MIMQMYELYCSQSVDSNNIAHMPYTPTEKNDKYDCLFASKLHARRRQGLKRVNWFLFVEMFRHTLLWSSAVTSLVDWFPQNCVWKTYLCELEILPLKWTVESIERLNSLNLWNHVLYIQDSRKSNLCESEIENLSYLVVLRTNKLNSISGIYWVFTIV